jgi:hypothetical protein
MTRRMLTILTPLLLSGCGPLTAPLTLPLCPEQQKIIDESWNNMLAPADRLDRELLFDVVAAGSLYQLGVDRLHLRSEKNYNHGQVIMEIDCDRASPNTDQFTITILDERAQTIRRERYSREEIEERLKALYESPLAEQKDKPESPEQAQRRLEREKHQQRIAAATQPASVR